jgi:hypothetical protein
MAQCAQGKEGREDRHSESERESMTDIPGLAQPWRWIQPRNDEELIKRLFEAADYMVHERERAQRKGKRK